MTYEWRCRTCSTICYVEGRSSEYDRPPTLECCDSPSWARFISSLAVNTSDCSFPKDFSKILGKPPGTIVAKNGGEKARLFAENKILDPRDVYCGDYFSETGGFLKGSVFDKSEPPPPSDNAVRILEQCRFISTPTQE